MYLRPRFLFSGIWALLELIHKKIIVLGWRNSILRAFWCTQWLLKFHNIVKRVITDQRIHILVHIWFSIFGNKSIINFISESLILLEFLAITFITIHPLLRLLDAFFIQVFLHLLPQHSFQSLLIKPFRRLTFFSRILIAANTIPFSKFRRRTLLFATLDWR